VERPGRPAKSPCPNTNPQRQDHQLTGAQMSPWIQAEEERGDTLFVAERRRSRRLQRAIRSERSEQSDSRSRAAVVSQASGSQALASASGASLLVDPVCLIDGRHTAYGAQHVIQVRGVGGLEGELGSADAIFAGVESGGQDVDVLV
jgi:sirohydrochlorin ferrochelatase